MNKHREETLTQMRLLVSRALAENQNFISRLLPVMNTPTQRLCRALEELQAKIRAVQTMEAQVQASQLTIDAMFLLGQDVKQSLNDIALEDLKMKRGEEKDEAMDTLATLVTTFLERLDVIVASTVTDSRRDDIKAPSKCYALKSLTNDKCSQNPTKLSSASEDLHNASSDFLQHEDGKKIAETFGYSQAAKLPNGAVILAGMLGVDSAMNLAPTLDGQVETILNHVDAALSEAGEKPSDVYKVTNYHLSIEQSAGPVTAAWLARYSVKPTWTAVGVRELGVPGALLEIQVEAWPSA
ncbi:YjgF-like protein [Coniochaeta ligniaria NRRL 30616]|uniref:YjgF-like protein n=1 Tax=Coniochaeta ligniaria NRRL 30616 TaxID=1408157 RepID=A0A1J7J3S9_9PEZI|nr:YjgF-like protein [Coniochaeta ligniaria NRRL 30616]